MMSNSNKISIPKEVFENMFFAEGGEKRDLFKAVTGEYQFALDSKKPMVEPNAEIEGGEYLFDSQGVRKAEGKSHEKGGMKVSLEDGTRILSDHLRIGLDVAKKIKKELDISAKATDTYAKVLDRYNKKSGLEDLNIKLEELAKSVKVQKTKVKDEDTSNLNLDYLTKQLFETNQKKKPLEKEREGLFDLLFEVQESTKEAPESANKMENGGVIELANKYGISQERAAELIKGMPMYQDAGQYIKGDMNLDGVVDEKGNLYNDYKQLYNKNRDLIIKSSGRTDFTKSPMTVNTLPYTPREASSNPIWQGASYETAWKPLVETSMSDDAKAKSIDEWLTKNKDKYSPNIQKQLEGLTGKDRMAKIKALATDYKPGPFHNALLQAMVETTEPEPPAKETPKEEVKPIIQGNNRTYSSLGLPQRLYIPPTLQNALKVSTRLNRVEPTLISPTQQIAETDRAVQAAQQNLAGMSDAQKAAAAIGLTATQSSATGKAIQEANRYNAQAQGQADIYNAKIGDTEQLYENQNALNYEGRIMRGLANYENDMQNLRNLRYSDQVNNYKTVEMMNAQNAYNPQVQYLGTGLGYDTNYTPDFSRVHSAEVSNLANAGKNKKVAKKASAKFGGRFKK
jgi:regulator of protease activity HflC (stomatin/prohibitin superfamily)